MAEEPTQPHDEERAFFARADAFLRLANEHCDDAERPRVSAAFLFAVTRFHAWEAARTCSSGEELANDKDSAVGWFVSRYKQMLEQNLDDYARNFDAYMKDDRPGSGGSGAGG